MEIGETIVNGGLLEIPYFILGHRIKGRKTSHLEEGREANPTLKH